MSWLSWLSWLNAPLVLLFIGGLGYLYRQEVERRQAAERQVADRKYATYTQLVDHIFQVMEAGRTGIPMDPDTLHTTTVAVNKDLLIYGSDAVVRAYQKLLQAGRKGDATILGYWGETLLAIRRDMGNASTTLQTHDVLQQFITDLDDTMLPPPKH